jgi:hypothetical protein
MQEFQQVAIGAATVSYTALVVALISIARSDDLGSKTTLGVFVVGALALALSDRYAFACGLFHQTAV